MNINNNEVIIGCDIDGTLIRPTKAGEIAELTVVNPYDNKSYDYIIHNEHVELLRQYKGRGFFIRAWSANGVKHAHSVILALGLDDGTIGSVETKPMKHMDDRKDLEAIVGARVFIPKEGF